MNEDIAPTPLGDGCIGLNGESRILPVEATQSHERLSRQVAAVIAGGALTGLVADSLLRTMPGVNIALFVLFLTIARILSGRFAGRPLTRAGAVLYGAAFVAALGMAWRDAPTLRGLNGLVCLFLLMLAAVADNGLWRWGVTDYLGRTLSGLFDTLSGAFVPQEREILWLRLPRVVLSRNTIAVMRGLALLLPLLLLFGALLVLADAQFEKLANRLFDWDMQSLLVHGLWVVVFSWLATGYLRRQLDHAGAGPSPALVTPSRLVLGGIEASVVLIGLNLLFLSFILVQSHYLFGGRDHVTATAGLTLASYARRGFFELAAVAVLVLPMLWSAEWCLRRDNPVAVRWFQGLAGFTVLMMFCIIAGALHRMWLYMQSYGLTELRLYTSAFMIMLAVVFAWFAVTVLRNRRERFLAGAVAIGFASVIAVNAINPDALITRTNLARHAEGREIDIRYLAHRSFDAIPAVAQCKAIPLAKHIGESILTAGQRNETGRDWRSWNWGKYHAMKLYGVEQ